MLWILGWPITERFMLDFAKRRNLVPKGRKKVDDFTLLSATISYIGAHTNCRVWCCWVDGDQELVFEICSYDGPRSKPPKSIKPSDLPPREITKRLMMLLEVHERPYWYPYDNGSEAPPPGRISAFRSKDEEETTSDDDEFSSDEEWDSDGDETEVGYSDNDEEENDRPNDGKDSCSEAEVSDPNIHEDVACDESMRALPPAFDAKCNI